jgi:hypothetical protein
MSALTSQQVSRVWSDDAADRTAVYKVSKVTAGDTVDLGPTGVVPDYQLVKQAAMIATTVAGTAACSVSGTVITIPAGLTNDAGYIIVWGDTN